MNDQHNITTKTTGILRYATGWIADYEYNDVTKARAVIRGLHSNLPTAIHAVQASENGFEFESDIISCVFRIVEMQPVANPRIPLLTIHGDGGVWIDADMKLTIAYIRPDSFDGRQWAEACDACEARRQGLSAMGEEE